MSDEVRSNSLTAPAEAEATAQRPTEELSMPEVGLQGAPEAAAPPIFLSEPPTMPGPRAPEREASAIPAAAAEAGVDSARQLLPQLSSELSPPHHTERPPPPSQRAARASGPPLVALDGELEEPARRALSEPVPLVVRTATPTLRTSTLPPGLVEPKRIIEVLGSNVPVLDSAWEEEIEDLDSTEAYEVSETPPPQRTRSDSEPELELELVVDDAADSEQRDESGEGEPSGAEAAASRSDESDGVRSEASELDAAAPTPDPTITTAGGDSAAELDAALAESLPPSSPDEEARGAKPAPEQRPARAKAPPNKRKRPPPPSTRLTEKAKIETSPPARKWWEEMFSEEFLRAIPILSPRQLVREVNFVEESLGVVPGGRILDLACGAGQHAVELAARGYDLVGFDLSQAQLDWASGLATERGQRLQFTHGDMRELAYQEAFDAVYCWNTSFGFFEEEKNIDVAQRMFRALRPGGRLLLDVINRDFVVSQQPGQTWFEGDGCVCIDDVTVDFITSRMRVKRTLMLTNGKNRECTYSVRIYGLHELGKILHDVGFKVLKVSGRPEMPGVFFGSSSPRIIILAAKP